MNEADSIPLTCPNPRCQKRLRVRAQLAGKQVRCPETSCGQVIDVPMPRQRQINTGTSRDVRPRWRWFVVGVLLGMALGAAGGFAWDSRSEARPLRDALATAEQKCRELTASNHELKKRLAGTEQKAREAVTMVNHLRRQLLAPGIPADGEKASWQLDDVQIAFTTQIDGTPQMITVMAGTKILVVTGKLSHAVLPRASVSEQQVTLACKTKGGAAVFTAPPAAFGLVRTRQISWITPGPLVKGAIEAADEKIVTRMAVSREEGKPVVFTLKENQSHIALAFLIPIDGTAPFELRFGDLEKRISPH